MAAIALTAIGIFAIGVVIGVIAMVSHGIHREQRRFDEARRYREEQGIWDASEAPEYFLSDAPDGVSNAARREVTNAAPALGWSRDASAAECQRNRNDETGHLVATSRRWSPDEEWINRSRSEREMSHGG